MVKDHPWLMLGPVWSDEVCDWCGGRADLIVHLTWDDGVDEDYKPSCFDHNVENAVALVAAYRQRCR